MATNNNNTNKTKTEETKTVKVKNLNLDLDPDKLKELANQSSVDEETTDEVVNEKDKSEKQINPLKSSLEKIREFIYLEDISKLKKVFEKDVEEICNGDKIDAEKFSKLTEVLISRILKITTLSLDDKDIELLRIDNDKKAASILARLTQTKPDDETFSRERFDRVLSNKCELFKYINCFVKIANTEFLKSIGEDELNELYQKFNKIFFGVNAETYLKSYIAKRPELEYMINYVIEQMDGTKIWLFKPDFMDFDIPSFIERSELKEDSCLTFIGYMGIITKSMLETTINIDDSNVRRFFINLELIEPNKDEIESMIISDTLEDKEEDEVEQEVEIEKMTDQEKELLKLL